MAKAQQLGVSPGPAYGALKAGEPVSLPGELAVSNSTATRTLLHLLFVVGLVDNNIVGSVSS